MTSANPNSEPTPNHGFKPFHALLAVGVGLIGGSACLDVRKTQLAECILGYSRRFETAQEAVKLGLVDKALADLSADALVDVDVVLISIPVQQYAHLLQQLLPVLPAHALMMDAGSTKADCEALIAQLEPNFPGLTERFVPCHPIAGAELHGPKAARAGLFSGRNVVLTPGPFTGPDRVNAAAQFWQALGAQVQTMAATVHDETFARVSHLPHALAFAYVAAMLQLPNGESCLKEGGAGFQDFTRIAASSPEMWADILLNNKSAVLQAAVGFNATWLKLTQAIECNDRGAILAILNSAAQYRAAWTGAHSASNPTSQLNATSISATSISATSTSSTISKP